jgi:AAA ATPase domain
VRGVGPVPFWMVFEPVNPADTFFEIAVEALVGKLSAAAARAFLGTPAEQALRDVFATAIDTVVGQIANPDAAHAGPDAKSRLRAALRAKRKEFAKARKFHDLSGLVKTWTETVEGEVGRQCLDELGVRRQWLADRLCAEIAEGVRANALENGPLRPLATDADLQKIFGHMREVLAELAHIKGTLQHLTEQRAETGARPEAGQGARTVIEERTANFTGREHYVRKIDDLILNNPANPYGYVLVVGEPGIGKTALLSYLIETRGYLHHINNRRQEITSTQAFLREICEQLARRCGLPVPPEPDSSTLSALLRQAARDAGPDAPLVVAVDALDESDLPSSLSANRLLLPPVLPPHVYFLITSRPQKDYQLNVENLFPVIRIGDNDPANLLDIRRYIDEQLKGPYATAFVHQVAAWKMGREEFVDFMVGKSQGNFLYIFHMLTSIRLGRLSQAAIGDIRKLPQGLGDYYRYHWDVMGELWPGDLWRKHRTAVRCMAAISRPMSVKMLVRTAGEENLPGVDEDLAHTIFDTWREFFNSERDRDTEEELLYVYHDTFREFLNSDESLASLAYKLRRRQNTLLRQRLDRYS